MSDISSIGPSMNGTPAPIAPINRIASVPSHSEVNRPAMAAPKSGEDRVELSNFSKYLAHLRELPDVRHERVESLRQSIAAESYESDEKLDIAIERWAIEEL